MVICSMPDCQTTAGCQCQRAGIRDWSPQVLADAALPTEWGLAFAAGRAQALREAAQMARATKSYDDNLQKSAGCHTTGERVAAAIEALAKP